MLVSMLGTTPHALPPQDLFFFACMHAFGIYHIVQNYWLIILVTWEETNISVWAVTDHWRISWLIFREHLAMWHCGMHHALAQSWTVEDSDGELFVVVDGLITQLGNKWVGLGCCWVCILLLLSSIIYRVNSKDEKPERVWFWSL